MNDAQRKIEEYVAATVMAGLKQPPGPVREELRKLAQSLRRIEKQLAQIAQPAPSIILAYALETERARASDLNDELPDE